MKARKKGKLAWDAFSDEGRLVLEDFAEEYQTQEQYVQWHINLLKNASQSYMIPRWHRQPHYVEVWIEKQALEDTFSSFLLILNPCEMNDDICLVIQLRMS